MEQDRKMGQIKQNEFIRKKVTNARANQEQDQKKMQDEISTFEREAQELEQLEADLLRKLQDTQKNEREAFGRLEHAMVDASVPKHMRINGGATDGLSQMS